MNTNTVNGISKSNGFLAIVANLYEGEDSRLQLEDEMAEQTIYAQSLVLPHFLLVNQCLCGNDVMALFGGADVRALEYYDPASPKQGMDNLLARIKETISPNGRSDGQKQEREDHHGGGPKKQDPTRPSKAQKGRQGQRALASRHNNPG